jgi:predicted Co/Zn/Cd cation transporter (cation efflux family)
MNPHQPTSQKKGLTAIDGAMSMIVVLLMVQMWLLTSALEALLAGHREAALPAAVISGIIFGACLALFFLVKRIDADVRHG